MKDRMLAVIMLIGLPIVLVLSPIWAVVWILTDKSFIGKYVDIMDDKFLS